MSDAFNPYLKWLGIPLKHQPPHHYRLLGLEPFEQDADVIENAADRQMAHVRTFQTGKHSDAAQKLLNELAAASGCLLDPRRKGKYDEALRAKLNSAQAAPVPPPVSRPLPPSPATGGAHGSETHATASRPLPAHPVATAVPAYAHPPSQPSAASSGTQRVVGQPVTGQPVTGQPVVGQPAIGQPVFAARVPAAPMAASAAPYAAPAPTATFESPASEPAATQVASTRALAGYYRRRRTPAVLLLVLSLLAACVAMGAVYFVLKGLPVANEDSVVRDAEGSARDVSTPTSSNTGANVDGHGQDEGAPTTPTTTPTTSTTTDDSGAATDGHSPTTDTTSPTSPGTSPSTPTTPVVPTPPPVSTGSTAAEIAVSTSCAIGVLKKGARYRTGTSLEIVELSPELEGLKFTRWPTLAAGAIGFEVQSAGRAYVLARPEYYDEVLAKLGGGNTVTRTDFVCRLGVVGGEPTRCAVYQIDFSAGKFDFDGDIVQPILASEKLTLADPKLLAAEEPEVPPSTTPLPGADFLAAQAERHAPPSEATIAKATAQVDSLYFDKVKTPAEREAAVQKLLADAENAAGASSDDQYVMLHRALEESAATGDLPLALKAADALGQQFDVDRAALRLDAVTRASKVPAPPPLKVMLYAAAFPVLEEAVKAGRYDEVEHLSTPMLSVAQRAGDRDLSVKLAELRKRTETLAAEQRRFKAAQTALDANPDDAAANLAVGQFQAFVKRDWDKGLALLAKGSDAALSAAAKHDLADPQDAAECVKLADTWAGLATGRDDQSRASLLARAHYWYTRALPQLSGLEQKGAESKIAGIESTLKSLSQPAAEGPRRAYLVAGADYEFQLYINGEYVMSGRGAQLHAVERTLKPGDVIAVKANNADGDFGFVCTIQFEGTKRPLATGAADSGWRTYQPASRETWYDVQGIGGEAEPAVASGGPHEEILRQAGLPCGSIWSSDSREAFLVLRVR